jgi:hypothetical protein
MTGYAKLREREGKWADIDLRDLEGKPFDGTYLPEIVKSVCFDGMATGLYVLTDDDDTYFTCPSIVLEFIDDIHLLEAFTQLKYERDKAVTKLEAIQSQLTK